MNNTRVVLTAYSYHWALLTGPKNEADDAVGRRYHAKQTLTIDQGVTVSRWEFEERDIRMGPTAMILVRILVGKIKDEKRVGSLLRRVAMKPDQVDWNCVGWVEDALDVLRRDDKALSTDLESWETIRYYAMSYAHGKNKAHRFDGQAPKGTYDPSAVPTWDLIEKKEITM